MFTLRYTDLEAMLVTLGVSMNDDGTICLSAPSFAPTQAPVAGDLASPAPRHSAASVSSASSRGTAASAPATARTGAPEAVAFNLAEFTRIRVLGCGAFGKVRRPCCEVHG